MLLINDMSVMKYSGLMLAIYGILLPQRTIKTLGCFNLWLEKIWTNSTAALSETRKRPCVNEAWLETTQRLGLSIFYHGLKQSSILRLHFCSVKIC